MDVKIIKFLKPTGGKYKKLSDINHYLNLQLSAHVLYEWNFNEKIRKIYSTDFYKFYMNHRVLVYFPNENIRIFVFDSFT